MSTRRIDPFKRPLAVVAAVLLTSCCSGTSYGDPGDAAANPSLSRIVASHALYAEDDFDGPANSRPNSAIWNIETGGVGWGGGEAQAYTADPDNVRLDGDGNLVIQASQKGASVTSARLNTQGKVELADGLVAARIRMPAGQGLHPAFWMLGRSINSVGWPACGEIDIVELLNSGSTAYFTALGPPGAGQRSGSHSQVQLTHDAGDLVDGFHTYWLYKQPRQLIFGIDENVLATISPEDNTDGGQWVFDTPYFAVLNLAVGGDWPGPLGPGVLPKQMTVDWVRFYR